MDFSSFSDSDWQRFVSLSVILILVVNSVFFSRNLAFSKILKYLAIWSIAGLIIISLYSYRFEFADFKTRILRELNPASIQVNKNGELEINISQDGHFYINVKINNVLVRFMIDTGASDIVISMTEAERIGIDLKKLNFNKPYQTANGKAWGASILLDKIEVGDASFENVQASINKAEMGTSLLGMGFLRKFKKYEFYRDRLILTI